MIAVFMFYSAIFDTFISPVLRQDVEVEGQGWNVTMIRVQYQLVNL